MTTASKTIYAALGDSLGVGVGARDGRGYAARLHQRLQRERSGVRLLNLCIPGATSRGLLDRQLARAIAEAPALATVLIGINDLIQGVAPPTFERNIAQIAESLGRCDTRVLFCTVPDLAHAPAARTFSSRWGIERSFFEGVIRAYNRSIEEHARRHGHALLDLFGLPLADPERFFSADGFHPSEHGYEALADQLWPAFGQLAAETVPG